MLGANLCSWKSMMDGKFSVNSAYSSLTEPVNVRINSEWKVVWKTELPPKIKHFLWLVKHKRILTNCERAR